MDFSKEEVRLIVLLPNLRQFDTISVALFEYGDLRTSVFIKATRPYQTMVDGNTK